MSDVFDRALITHALIKKRLCEAVSDPEAADPADIRSDRACVFGVWIYGPEGTRQSWRPEIVALRTIHARFHEAAYQALLAAREGRLAEAQHSLATGEFETCSQQMKQALIAVKAARS